MRTRSLIAGTCSTAALSAIFLGIPGGLVSQAALSLVAGSLATLGGGLTTFLVGLLVILNTVVMKEVPILTVLTAYVAPYLASVAVIARFWRVPFSLKDLNIQRTYLAPAIISVGASLTTLGIIYVAGADLMIASVPSYGSVWQLLLLLTISVVTGFSLNGGGPAIASLAGSAIPLFSPISVLMASVGTRRLVEPAGGDVTIGEIIGVVEEGGVRESRGLATLNFRGGGSHTVIVGATGTGKSRLLKNIAGELRFRGYGVIVIDTHGEHAGSEDFISLTPNKVRLDLASGDRHEIDDLTDIISEAFRLGSLQRAVLHEAISSVYERSDGTLSLKDVVDELSSEPLTPVKRSLITYLRSLSKHFGDSGVGVQELLTAGTVHIIDISSMGHVAARVFVDILLRSIIYSSMRKPSRAVVMVEEAHRYVGGRTTALGRIFREGRKFGITAVITTQGPTDLPSDVYVNSRYIISFTVADARGASYLAQTISGGSRPTYLGVRKVLASLRKGEALLWDREDSLIRVVRTF